MTAQSTSLQDWLHAARGRKTQLRDAIGVSRVTISNWSKGRGVQRRFRERIAKATGLPLQNIPIASVAVSDNERALDMAERYTNGATLQEIGDFYGLTRERVRQIITKAFGALSNEGGATLRAQQKTRAAKARRDRKYLNRYGMTRAEFRRINDPSIAYRDRPIAAYRRQQGNSNSRGIAWNITFAEWWLVWSESGQWAQRGRGKDHYVMARHSDTGAYELGNVKIILADDNQREYIKRYWRDVRSGKRDRPAPSRKTHCKYGHPFAGTNLYTTPNGHRACRTCQRRRGRAYNAKKRNQAPTPGRPHLTGASE